MEHTQRRHKSFLASQSLGSNSLSKTPGPEGESHGQKVTPTRHVSAGQGMQADWGPCTLCSLLGLSTANQGPEDQGALLTASMHTSLWGHWAGGKQRRPGAMMGGDPQPSHDPGRWVTAVSANCSPSASRILTVSFLFHLIPDQIIFSSLYDQSYLPIQEVFVFL